MAVDIIVKRGLGDRPGPDIVDPLIASQAVALNRGRNELDAKAERLQPVRYQAVFRSGILLGQLVEVQDLFTATVFRGKVVSITHEVGDGTAITQLEIEKVQAF